MTGLREWLDSEIQHAQARDARPGSTTRACLQGRIQALKESRRELAEDGQE